MELARSAAAVPQDEAQPWIPRLPSDKTQHGQREARLGDGVSIGTVVVGMLLQSGHSIVSLTRLAGRCSPHSGPAFQA